MSFTHTASRENARSHPHEGYMYYYGYGSNLSLPYVHAYCPSADFVLRADLPNYRIEFRRYSTELQGGISSIMESPGDLVHGVIYAVLQAEIEALDILEDVPRGIYTRECFRVLGEDGSWYLADLYRVARPEGPFTPSRVYVDYMVAGATAHQLETSYVAGLLALRQSLD